MSIGQVASEDGWLWAPRSNSFERAPAGPKRSCEGSFSRCGLRCERERNARLGSCEAPLLLVVPMRQTPAALGAKRRSAAGRRGGGFRIGPSFPLSVAGVAAEGHSKASVVKNRHEWCVPTTPSTFIGGPAQSVSMAACPRIVPNIFGWAAYCERQEGNHEGCPYGWIRLSSWFAVETVPDVSYTHIC